MIVTKMKKDYIIPTIFLIKYEEESELLVSLSKAASVHAASDVHNSSMDDNPLNISNDGKISEEDYAKKTDWFFDNGLFD